MRAAVLALSLAVLAPLALASPAEAALRRKHDTPDDAPAYADIVRVVGRNTAARVQVAVQVRRVDPDRTHTRITVTPANDEKPLFLVRTLLPRATSRSAREVAVDGLVQKVSPTGARTRVKCPGLDVVRQRGGQGYVRYVVPQKCLGDIGGAVLVEAGTSDGEGDTSLDELAGRLRVPQG